jgi:8-oxo-dGTP pyrophosphatase MutT (NUDIX family)
MNNEKQKFVLGFVFDKDFERVLLIKKKRAPKGVEKMVGMLNGIGGHLHKGEYAHVGMFRECKEETGMEIDNWTLFCNFEAEFGYVHCFYAIVDSFCKIINSKQTETTYTHSFKIIYEQMEDEEIGDYWIEQDKGKDRYGDYRDLRHMPNIRWMIPMAINHAKKLDNCELFEVKETYNS